MFCFRGILYSKSASSLAETTALSTWRHFKQIRSREVPLRRRIDRHRRRSQARKRFVHDKYVAMKETLSKTTNPRDHMMAKLADDIFSRGHQFLCSACNIAYIPDGNPACPEVALLGREDSGKSSLLRSLFRASREVGRSNSAIRREGMNYFSVGGGIFNIVDCPGFGSTSVPWVILLQYAVIIRNFVRFRPNLKMMYYCMDVNHQHGVYIQDLDLLKFLSKEVPNFTIILTKCENLTEPSQKQGGSVLSVRDIQDELLRNEIYHPVISTSSFRMAGVDTVRFDMVYNCLHAIPTEKLTLAEAKRFSKRLFTQREIGSIRPLFFPPTATDDELLLWNATCKSESVENEGRAECLSLPTVVNSISKNMSDSSLLSSKSCLGSINYPDSPIDSYSGESVENNSKSITKYEAGTPPEDNVNTGKQTEYLNSHKSIQSKVEDNFESLATSCEHNCNFVGNSFKPIETKRSCDDGVSHDALDMGKDNPLKKRIQDYLSLPEVQERLSQLSHEDQKAYRSLVSKLSRSDLMTYINRTNPWRNAIYWPSYVHPTKHPRANIMRCPGDPHNPYLEQPAFVVPRMDMYFRRPNVGNKKGKQKGLYTSDKPMSIINRPTTIPYFPDIVDIQLHPQPWAFLGSKEAYFERPGGRQLGIRLSNYNLSGLINPLSDEPFASNPILSGYLTQLEECYDARCSPLLERNSKMVMETKDAKLDDSFLLNSISNPPSNSDDLEHSNITFLTPDS